MRTARRLDGWGPLLLVVPFLLLFWAALGHHALWRDELNAWALARSAANLPALFAALHYEGHPALWYLLLYAASRFTRNPVAMRLIEGGVGTASLLLVARLPFRRVETLLLLCNYFVLFEYTVMSRMYSLQLLVALVYAAVRLRWPRRVVPLAVLLGVLANVDGTGLLLALALGLELWLFVREEPGPRPSRGERITAAGIFAGFAAASVATMFPAQDISHHGPAHPPALVYAKLLWHATQSWVVLPWFPEPDNFPHHFWGASVFQHAVRDSLLVPCVLVAYGLLFRRVPRLLLALGALLVEGILFTTVIYPHASMRHFGVLFVGFVVFVAILRQADRTPSRALLALLLVGAVGGLGSEFAQWRHPFADDEAAAHFLVDTGLSDAALIGEPDAKTFGVAQLLDRPMYQLECQCEGRAMRWGRERDSYLSDAQLPERLMTGVARYPGRTVVFLLNRPLSPEETVALEHHGLEPVALHSFKEGEVPDEHLFLYRLAAPA